MNMSRKAIAVASVGAMAAGMTLLGVGTASAGPNDCKDQVGAVTTGRLPADVPQQINKNVGKGLDLTACTTDSINYGLNLPPGQV